MWARLHHCTHGGQRIPWGNPFLHHMRLRGQIQAADWPTSSLSFPFLLKKYLFLYIGVLSVFISAYHQRTPWDYSYRQLWATMWLLGTELRTSVRAARALSHLPRLLSFSNQGICLLILRPWRPLLSSFVGTWAHLPVLVKVEVVLRIKPTALHHGRCVLCPCPMFQPWLQFPLVLWLTSQCTFKLLLMKQKLYLPVGQWTVPPDRKPGKAELIQEPWKLS